MWSQFPPNLSCLQNNPPKNNVEPVPSKSECPQNNPTGNSFQNENTFLQKNLIGLLYYDPIANVCIYDLTLFYSVSFYFVYFSFTAQICKLKFKSEFYWRIKIGNREKNANTGSHTLISWKMPIPFLYFRETTCWPKYVCRKIQPYSCYCFSKILRTFYASRNLWIIDNRLSCQKWTQLRQTPEGKIFVSWIICFD